LPNKNQLTRKTLLIWPISVANTYIRRSNTFKSSRVSHSFPVRPCRKVVHWESLQGPSAKNGQSTPDMIIRRKKASTRSSPTNAASATSTIVSSIRHFTFVSPSTQAHGSHETWMSPFCDSLHAHTSQEIRMPPICESMHAHRSHEIRMYPICDSMHAHESHEIRMSPICDSMHAHESHEIVCLPFVTACMLTSHMKYVCLPFVTAYMLT